MSKDADADKSMPTDALFAANMDAMAKWAPKLHARLSRIEETHSQLVTRPEGGLDMCLQHQYFYGRDAADYTREQLDGFKRDPVRRYFNEPNPVALEGVAGDYCKRIVARMAETGIAINCDRVESSSYFTIVFGIGLGLHLAPLIELSACRALILVEPNLENIYHSLSVIDWAEIIEPEGAPPRHIRFITSDDPSVIGVHILNAVRTLSPALLDGAYIFTHYYSSVLENAKQCFQRDFYLSLTGLGFFEDELIMAANVAGNLAHCPIAILDGPQPSRDEPVFIVGSGPSVDQDMAFIAANADRAVVFSAAGGLRGLLAAGVRPDFHIELENGPLTTDNLRLTEAEFGLLGITLVGAMTVEPELAALFDDPIMFFRERSTATMLFGQNCGTVSPSGPTVANAGLSVALIMGFREIYLFGIDMGTRSTERFHSKNSQVGVGARKEEMHLERQFEVPANFGGESHAGQTMSWSRAVIEMSLASRPQIRCYNCSDGASIAHAIPKLSRTVELPPLALDRQVLIDAIRGDLVVYSEERRRRLWNHGERHAEAEQLLAQLCTIIDQAALRPDPGRDWIHTLCEAIDIEGPAPRQVLSFIHGTMMLLLGSTWWYDRRLTSPEAQRRFRRLAMAELRIAIEAMASRLAHLYEDIDAYFDGNLDRVPATSAD